MALLSGWLVGLGLVSYSVADEPAKPAGQNVAATGEEKPAAPPAAPAPPDDRLAPATIDKADVAWMMVSSALVLMMTAPGLALFYCGLVRKKNVLSVMMQCVFLMGLMSIVWALWGYSLAFGTDVAGGIVGGPTYLGLQGVLPTAVHTPGPDGKIVTTVTVPMAASIPRALHMVYQMMFFIITPALICGAFAERMKFSAMVLFSVLWGTFVYCPLAHWVWSDTGWFNFLNTNPPTQAPFPSFDFAGGTVVHISSGISALVCCLMLGRRLGYGQEPMPPHNLTYTCIGAAMLWVGWFGFNAGSALGSNVQAVNAFVATHLAAAAGVLTWAGAEWITRGKPSILGACSGAVAGLVCVTPACGMVTPIAGIILGAAAGIVCYLACFMKAKLGYDDSLDAFGVHGVGGTLGAVLTGVFATASVIPGANGPQGLLEGNVKQFANQLVGAGAAIVIGIIGTLILLKIVDVLVGLRVSQVDEMQGLDLSQHGEEGYITY